MFTRPLNRGNSREWVRQHLEKIRDGVPPAIARSGEPWTAGPVDFGLSLACGACGWERGEGPARFVTDVEPVVVRVLPGGPAAVAGIQPGDTLVSLAEFPVTGSVPDLVWAALAAGRPVWLGVRRDRIVELIVVPRDVRF